MQGIQANVTSPVARFAVSNLHPGSVYIVSVYAFNSKGRSDPAVLPAAMLRPAEKQLTSEKGNYILQQTYFNIHTNMDVAHSHEQSRVPLKKNKKQSEELK